MHNNITLNELVEFCHNEEKLLADIFGEKAASNTPVLKKETIENIKNYSKVLSIRESNSLLKQFEFVLN